MESRGRKRRGRPTRRATVVPQRSRPVLKPTAPPRRSPSTTKITLPKPAYPVLVGPYRLGEKIASGGMADVFRARPTIGGATSGRLVIKAMHAHLGNDPMYRSMFVREARLCQSLEHENIVRLADFFATVDGLFLVFEFVDGIDVRRLLKTCAARRVRVPPTLAAFIIAHVLEALDYAHSVRIGGRQAAIVHRDISPSNILLSWRGRVKLADFGVAQMTSKAPSREKALLTGKFGYMSPEQLRGESLDARSDMFSCGVVLAELLTCRRLFLAESTAELLLAVDNVDLERLHSFGGDVPGGLLDIALRALSRDPTERYATSAEFRDALCTWMATQSVRAGSAPLAGFLAEVRPQLVPD